MLVMGFDCTAPRLTLGLADGDRALGRWDDTPQKHRGDALDGLIDRALGETGVTRADVRGLALVTGPGSLTATRIGWATACGWAKSTGIPITGWTTPHVQWRKWMGTDSASLVITRHLKSDATVYCMIHHRGLEFYCYQLADESPPGNPVAVLLDQWRPSAVPAVLLGPGLLSHRDKWASMITPNLEIVSEDEALVGGDTLAQWGVAELSAGRRLDPTVSPLDYGLPPTFRKAS